MIKARFFGGPLDGETHIIEEGLPIYEVAVMPTLTHYPFDSEELCANLYPRRTTYYRQQGHLGVYAYLHESHPEAQCPEHN